MKKIKIKKNYGNKFFLAVAILFFVSLAVFLLTLRITFVGNVILEERNIPTELIIGEPAGFDLNDSVFNFGRIPYDAWGVRKLVLTNDYDFPVKYEFDVVGDISDFLVFEKIVYLEQGEKREVIVKTMMFKNETFWKLFWKCYC